MFRQKSFRLFLAGHNVFHPRFQDQVNSVLNDFLLAIKKRGGTEVSNEVREYKDEVIFLRKIKEGGASKSYGLHVAKLAGIPNVVIKRAEHILSNFYDNKITLNIGNKNQLPLFLDKIEDVNEKSKELLEELKEIDLDSLTPVDCLNILNSLKKKYDE